MSKGTTFKTHIGLAADVRDPIITLLNQLLADTLDLYTQTKGDAATADLITQLTRGLDQSLWFLEAHLQS